MLDKMLINSKARLQGFTLIEMMVVVAMLAIVISVAAPSMSQAIERSRQNATHNELLQAVRLASAQAASSSRPVRFCSSNDNSNCSGTWNNGWIIYVDSNRNGAKDAGETILLTSSNSSHRKIKVTPTAIEFRPNGTNVSATFKICSDKYSSMDMEIEVSGFGVIATTKGVSGGC